MAKKEGNPFLIANINVLVSLKNNSGELEEKALIHIECKGDGSFQKKKYVMDGSQCSGVRMISPSDSKKINSHHFFVLFPKDVEILSKPYVDPLLLNWQGNTFAIHNEKNFIWTLKSKASGNVHTGSANCAKI